MNDLVARTCCVVPSRVLKLLLLLGIVGGVGLSIAKVMGLIVPSELIIGLVGFFFTGAILAGHGLSILRKPGLVLLVGTISMLVALRCQHLILKLF